LFFFFLLPRKKTVAKPLLAFTNFKNCPPDAQKVKNEKIKLMVNTGQVMFSGDIYYY